MLISGGTLVSDCHEAMIYMEGDEDRCIKCQQPCKSAGTLSEVMERRNAIPREHQRLRGAVADTAIAMCKLEHEADEGRNTLVRTDALIEAGKQRRALRTAVDALLEFESKQLHKVDVETME